MTGGAFGSMMAQLFKLTSVERKTLLVAGAAAGMSATFAAPLASVLLAFELLLFRMEAAQSCACSDGECHRRLLRQYLIGPPVSFRVRLSRHSSASKVCSFAWPRD
jgi:H+/Cl- antiporter ClcA